ncbi:hypothetical protein B0920_02015 [Massilia sp. KIM]|nr:hypothetical protein B0920_02015 [Massilia sp. KIM]
MGASYELQLSSRDDSTMRPLIPTLLDARLISMGTSRMLFKGVERGQDGSEWVQEWSIHVLGHGSASPQV